MSKKSRRTRKFQAPPRLSSSQLAKPSDELERSASAMPSPYPVRAAAAPKKVLTSLADEYPYVIADLKRIGIIALVMTAIMIVLALVLV
jgi:hypothetical protein